MSSQRYSPEFKDEAVPICLALHTLPLGIWLSDYFQRGIALPAPYLFQDQAYVSCSDDRIEVSSEDKVVATWKVWHDQWTPLHQETGATRCETVTELNTDKL